MVPVKCFLWGTNTADTQSETWKRARDSQPRADLGMFPLVYLARAAVCLVSKERKGEQPGQEVKCQAAPEDSRHLGSDVGRSHMQGDPCEVDTS